MTMFSTQASTHSQQSLTRPAVRSDLYLIAKLMDQAYAVELGTIREVIPLNEVGVTRVPNAASFVMGLFNLRGEILVLVSLGGLIEESAGLSQALSRIIILQVEHPVTGLSSRLGMAVSHVTEVVSLAIEPTVEPRRIPLSQGWSTWQEQRLIVLNSIAIAQVVRESGSPA